MPFRSTNTNNPNAAPILAYAAAFLGGASGLINETVWIRAISLETGATAPALALVVSVFFAGLALGSAAASRDLITNFRHARAYAALEVLIGLFTILFPYLFETLSVKNAPAPVFIAILAIPTFAMGATLPILTKAAGAGVARAANLYLLNTLGGAAGVAVAGFVMLELLGSRQTAFCAALLNFAAAACGFWIQRPAAAVNDTVSSVATPRRAAWVMAFACGAVSLSGEVVLNRLLYQVLGGTTYAISATLLIYLLAIVAGGWLARFFYHRVRFAAGAGFLALGIFTAVSFRLLEFLSGWLRSTAGPELELTSGLIKSAMVAVPVLALPALASGFLFPLILQMVGGAGSSALGRVYAINTFGGIVGSIGATFLLVPMFGTAQTLQIAGLAAACCAAIPLAGRARAVSIITIAILGGMSLGFPGRSEQFRLWLYDNLKDSAKLQIETEPSQERETILYHKEGVASTATVTERTAPGGVRALDFAINGKKEASTDFDALRNQFVLGHLPVLLHPSPKRALVVGLGAGVTAGAVAAHPGLDVTIAELSPEVPEATKRFGEYNHHVVSRKNVNIIIEDGRRFLKSRAADVEARAAEPFDVVTSDPIHPWVAGAANLYTVEYFTFAKRAMSQNGIAAHWLPLYEMRVEESVSIFKSFARAFPNCALWITYAGDAVLIGSPSPLKVNLTDFARRARFADVYKDLKSVRLDDPLRFLAGFAAGSAQIVNIPGNEITDDRQSLEFHAARNLYLSHTVPANLLFFAANAWSFEEFVQFINSGPAGSTRLKQLFVANLATLRARGAFQQKTRESFDAIVDAWSIEPDGEQLTFLADDPAFLDKLTNPKNAKEMLVLAALDARRARRAGGSERVERLTLGVKLLERASESAAGDVILLRAIARQRAILLGELGRYSEVIDTLAAYLNPPNRDPSLLRIAALAYKKLGSADRARECLQFANELDLRGDD
ncbi:MAG: spermidine synthase [Planctomycetota bacterium]